MYIWVGIDLDDELVTVKEKRLEIHRKMVFSVFDDILPQHISLVISADIPSERYGKTVKALKELFEKTAPFTVELCDIEKQNNIIWIRAMESEILARLHQEVARILKTDNGVPLHPFDLDFKYHTTLITEADEKKLNEAYSLFLDTRYKKEVKASSFVIGTSESGKVATYRVSERFYTSQK